ncbi:MAG: hypothetical protein AAF243_09250 [Cyanobacteria bacterium P01_A01_bin.137]
MEFKARIMRYAFSASLLALLTGLAACGGGTTTDTADAPADGGTEAASGISGDVLIDGSSTVFPIAEAMSEEFSNANPDVNVTVGVSGSGGGFLKSSVPVKLTFPTHLVPSKTKKLPAVRKQASHLSKCRSLLTV